MKATPLSSAIIDMAEGLDRLGGASRQFLWAIEELRVSNFWTRQLRLIRQHKMKRHGFRNWKRRA
jgi:hypothetical protein